MEWLTLATFSPPRVVRAAVLTMGTCALLSACGSSSDTTSPTGSTTLVGVVANVSQSGSVTVTIASGTLALALPRASKFAFFNFGTPAYAATTSVINATGTLAIQGLGKIALSGTYDTGTHALSLSGGSYTFTGTYSNGVLSGTFANPQGAVGGFSMQSGTTSSVLTFCGTASQGTSATGNFNVTLNLTTHVISGIAIDNRSQQALSLTGTTSGSSITGTASTGATFTGSFTPTNISGNFQGSAGGAGTFAGALCT